MTQYICPVCRAPRNATLSDDLPIAVHFQLGLTVIMISSISFLIGGWDLAWRTTFLYLPLWAIAEFIHWIKMREATKCHACGFDPVLYQRDWRKARNQVENRLGQVVQELEAQGRFIPSKLKQVTPTSKAGVANKEAAHSGLPQMNNQMNKAMNNVSTNRAVAPSSLENTKTPDNTPTQTKLL